MKKILLVFITALLLNRVYAQWQSTNGPLGENVISLVTNGQSLFAGTSGGVYVSMPNSGYWTVMNNGLTDNNGVPDTVDGIRLAINGNNLFAGGQISAGGGVFLSTNNAAGWVSVSDSLISSISPSFVSGIGTNGASTFVSTGDGNFLSTDSGATWTTADSGFITELNMFVFNGQYIFAGSDYGMFVSINNGYSWVPANTGLSDATINSLVLNGSNLYACTDGGLFVSTNNAASWTLVNMPEYLVTTALAIKDSYMFVGTDNYGIYESADNGLNWQTLNNGLGDKNISTLIIIDSTVYAGNSDGGGVWQFVIADIPTAISAPAAAPAATFNLFPNPGRGTVYYTGARAGCTLVVYDVLGHIIYTAETTGTTGTINLGGQANGVYFYSLMDDISRIGQGKIVLE